MQLFTYTFPKPGNWKWIEKARQTLTELKFMLTNLKGLLSCQGTPALNILGKFTLSFNSLLSKLCNLVISLYSQLLSKSFIQRGFEKGLDASVYTYMYSSRSEDLLIFLLNHDELATII